MSLKDLLDIAKTELKDLTTVENPDFRLEQAEFKKQENSWEIIVSYLVDNTNKRNFPMAAITGDFQYYRIYKRLKVDSEKHVIGLFIYNNKE